jgi:hypothetical protein
MKLQIVIAVERDGGPLTDEDVRDATKAVSKAIEVDDKDYNVGPYLRTDGLRWAYSVEDVP